MGWEGRNGRREKKEGGKELISEGTVERRKGEKNKKEGRGRKEEGTLENMNTAKAFALSNPIKSYKT